MKIKFKKFIAAIAIAATVVSSVFITDTTPVKAEEASLALTSVSQVYASSYSNGAQVKVRVTDELTAPEGQKIRYYYSVYSEDGTTLIKGYNGGSTSSDYWNKNTEEGATYTDLSISSLTAATTYLVKITPALYISYNNVVFGTPSELYVVTSPYIESGLKYKQTTYGKDYATLTWAAVEGANQYRVEYYLSSNSSKKYNKITKTNSVKLTLKANAYYYAVVYPQYVNEKTSFVSEASQCIRIDYSAQNSPSSIYAAPTVLGDLNATFYEASKKLNLCMSKRNYLIKKYSWTVYSSNGKTKYKSGTSTSSDGYCTVDFKYANSNTIFKVVVKGYYYNSAGKLTATAARTFYTCKSTDISASSKSKKITVKWKKISGTTRYAIYAAKGKDVKDWSKYKCVGTAASDKSAFTFNKFNKKAIKKGETYSIVVVAQKKISGKYYTVTNTGRRQYVNVKVK